MRRLYILPAVVAQFRTLYPTVQVGLSIGNTLSMEERIARNELDLGFVGGRLTREDIVAEPYSEDELVVIAQEGHRLARRRRVPFPEILHEPFVARESGSATWQCVDAWQKRADAELNVVLRLASPEAVKRAVAAGLGISIISRYAVSWEIQLGLLAVLKVTGFSLKRQLQMVRHRDRKPSRAAAAFVTVAKEALRE